MISGIDDACSNLNYLIFGYPASCAIRPFLLTIEYLLCNHALTICVRYDCTLMTLIPFYLSQVKL